MDLQDWRGLAAPLKAMMRTSSTSLDRDPDCHRAPPETVGPRHQPFSKSLEMARRALFDDLEIEYPIRCGYADCGEVCTSPIEFDEHITREHLQEAVCLFADQFSMPV